MPDANQPSEVRREFKQIPLTNPDAIKPVYANNIAVMNSDTEYRLAFSEYFVEEASAPARQELRALVTLSFSQAKALATILNGSIAQHEARFGQIAWPPPPQR